MTRALALALLLLCAAPAQAEDNYTVIPLGDGWVQVMLTEPVTLPHEGRWAVQVLIGLDDIPGLQPGPSPVVIPLEGIGPQRKAHLALSIMRFWPGVSGREAYVTLSLQDTRVEPEPGRYRLGVVVRGRE